MAAPWKLVLKAQDMLAHQLLQPSRLKTFEDYYSYSHRIALAYPDPVERARRIKVSVQAVGQRLSRMTREAEPIWVDRDMMHLVFERVAQYKNDEEYLEGIADARLHVYDLPVKNGVVIFQTPIIAPATRPEARQLIRDVEMTDVEQEFDDLSIYAIHYFDSHLQPYASELMQRNEEVPRGMGILTWGIHESWEVRDIAYIHPYITEPFLEEDTVYSRMERLQEQFPDRRDWGVHIPPGLTLLHLSQLLKERLVRVEKAGPNWRQHYRLMPRENTAGQVTVTHWRKYEDRPKDPDHVAEHRDWSCHWPVKSHLRHYKNGKVTEVRSYIKGDRTKPLKMPNTNIHIVDR